VFGAAQAADGMLRVIALVALLQQPQENLPDLLIIDEPELGLHPFAINVVAGLLRSVSIHTQVVIATQSVALIDHFDPEETVVVERQGRESTLRRLSSDDLGEWLEDYTLSELWEKNVIGGRPR
jgi:predicted ATPase